MQIMKKIHIFTSDKNLQKLRKATKKVYSRPTLLQFWHIFLEHCKHMGL